jgi:threonine dehydrogenase-like Zn-dependent dehydrogenase
MAVGVCASEVAHGHLTEGGSLGHELAGIVHKPGNKAVNLKEGDMVFIHHRVACLRVFLLMYIALQLLLIGKAC